MSAGGDYYRLAVSTSSGGRVCGIPGPNMLTPLRQLNLLIKTERPQR